MDDIMNQVLEKLISIEQRLSKVEAEVSIIKKLAATVGGLVVAVLAKLLGVG